MYNSNLEINLTLEQVAQYAVQTKLVTADEISIGVMTRSRYVIILPHGLVPDTFIRAIPQEIWKEGNLFYQWSPLEDATVAMPHFKVLMDLVGIPLDIFREKEVIQATSSMGTYLGMVAQEKKGDVATWTVVVATTDLSLIPHKIGYMVGGLEREVETIPKTWKHCPLYKADEIVHPEKRYKPVFDAITTPSKASPENLVCLGEDEMFQVSRAVLAELCRGRDLTILPEQIRAAVAEQPMEILTQSNILEVTKDQESLGAATGIPATFDPEGQDVATEVNIFVNSEHVLHDNYVAGIEKERDDPLYEVPIVVSKEAISGEESTLQKGKNQSPTSRLRASGGVNSVKEFSKYPPRILQRKKENSFDGGSCSKSVKSPSESLPIYCPRVLRPSTRQKRKTQEYARENRAKAKNRGAKAQEKKARLVTNLEGLVEVQVSYDYRSKLAAGLGFEPKQLKEALQLDNMERALIISEQQDGNQEEVNNNGQAEGEEEGWSHEEPVQNTEEDQGEHLTDFDPDSEDELDLDSDFE